MKSKFRQRVKLFFENIKQIKIDKNIRKTFVEDIKKEITDPRSEFNRLHLSTDEKYNSITTIVSLPENYQLAGSDIMKYQKLQELVMPINKYIRDNINYGEYLAAPEFYYIDSINDNVNEDEVLSEVSCSYVAEWKYTPVLEKYPNFKWEMAAFVGINTLLLGALAALLIVLI